MNGYTDNIVVFSNRAYNAIIDETLRMSPLETGGIFLGNVVPLDGCIVWLVLEVVPPGPRSCHEVAWFEYDKEYVDYTSTVWSSKYRIPLSILGLWHRHPGSMDYFSNVDDVSNAKFANMNPKYGAISGLVNMDPDFRLTMRHVTFPHKYQIIDVEVGDDLIPPQYFELSHYPLAVSDMVSDTDDKDLTHDSEEVLSESVSELKEDEPELDGQELVPDGNGNDSEVVDDGSDLQDPCKDDIEEQITKMKTNNISCLAKLMSLLLL